jgi:membrane protein DedA with SNARE-associated domain
MFSLQHLEDLVRSHGYWALLVGTFFEGETVLIIGGLCAKMGLLKLYDVTIVACIGGFLGDQAWFFIGYFKGRHILSKYNKLQRRIDGVHSAMKRYNTLIMLGFRFVYGMRMITPFVIGLDRQTRIIQFVILNAIGAALWSTIVAAGGYLFGYALMGVVSNIKGHEIHTIAIVSIVGLGLWAIRRYRSK